jgi:phosphohistidine phosphatase SixA
MSAQVDEGPRRLLLPPFRRGLVVEPAPLPRVLLRRADAQPREEWLGVEEWRGLSARGRAQADTLVARLGDLRVRRVLSSPSLRCRQTVVPLATSLDIDVEVCPELSHQAPIERLQALLEDDATEGAVFCTHREVLGRLFASLSRAAGSPGPAAVPPAASWTLATLAENGSVAAPALVPLG